MAKKGPIIVAEDDYEDQEIMLDVFQSLNITNEIKFYDNGEGVLSYLRTTSDQPFIIISDVKLRGMSGNELRREISRDDYLRKKSIPFIFLTTSANIISVEQAYDMMAQGYFQKGDNFQEIQSIIKMIIDYWMESHHPNSQ